MRRVPRNLVFKMFPGRETLYPEHQVAVEQFVDHELTAEEFAACMSDTSDELTTEDFAACLDDNPKIDKTSSVHDHFILKHELEQIIMTAEGEINFLKVSNYEPGNLIGILSGLKLMLELVQNNEMKELP